MYTFYDFRDRRDNTSVRREDTTFFATFDRPALAFICGHDAKFSIFLKDGEYSMEHSDPAARQTNTYVMSNHLPV